MENKKSSLYSLSNQMKGGWNEYSKIIPIMPPSAEKVTIIEEQEHMQKVETVEITEHAAICSGLVMACVPKQEWNEVYEPDMGFERGTIFPCLDYPFMGKGACSREQ